jgi:transcriptional regulator of aromatic amino acid metabolism
VAVGVDVKIASFCRELGDGTLEGLARGENALEAYLRARSAIEAGRVDQELEADLDSLNQAVLSVTGQGLFPSGNRAFQTLPGVQGTGGARF